MHHNRSSTPNPTGQKHGPKELAQQRPGRHVAPQAEHLLQAHRAGPVFLAGNMPDRSEPHPQRLSRVLKNRPCSYRTLIATCSTNQSPPRSRPVSAGAASGANKAFGPSEFDQIIPTGFFGCKPFFKFHDRSRVVFHARHYKSYGRWSQLNNPIEN